MTQKLAIVYEPVTVTIDGMTLSSVTKGDLRDTLVFSAGATSVTIVVESAEDWLKSHYGKDET